MIEYKLELGGCRCSVAEWNPDGKTVVVAFHGWLDNLATFEDLVKYLPDVRIIAVDFPGHGHSSHLPPGLSYHFIDNLFIIDDLVEHLRLKSVTLLGHSMGGAVATIYAAVQPTRVSKLLLIEALGPVTSPISQTNDWLSKAVSHRRAVKDKRKPIYETFDEALNTRAEVSKIAPKLIKPLVERALMLTEGGYTWKADARLRIPSSIRASEEQIRELLPKIKCPVLMIEAKEGLLTEESADYIQQRKSLVNDLTIHLMDGGHHLHLEYPKAVAAEILAFL